jgi:hypothetical protein
MSTTGLSVKSTGDIRSVDISATGPGKNTAFDGGQLNIARSGVRAQAGADICDFQVP